MKKTKPSTIHNTNEQKATMVTALFDINRETKSDGRTMSQYLQWLKVTLQLNCNMYIVTEKKYVDFVKKNRPKEYQHKTVIKETKLQNSTYYKYLEDISKIIDYGHQETPQKDMNNEYMIVIYSKFYCLEQAIKENPFKTSYFFWIDAGLSRFFINLNLKKEFPGRYLIEKSEDRFIIDTAPRRIKYVKSDYDECLWNFSHFVPAGIFGGYSKIILTVKKEVDIFLEKEMIDKKRIETEQIALGCVHTKYPDFFYPVLVRYFYPYLTIFLFNSLKLSSHTYLEKYFLRLNKKREFFLGCVDLLLGCYYTIRIFFNRKYISNLPPIITQEILSI